MLLHQCWLSTALWAVFLFVCFSSLLRFDCLWGNKWSSCEISCNPQCLMARKMWNAPSGSPGVYRARLSNACLPGFHESFSAPWGTCLSLHFPSTFRLPCIEIPCMLRFFCMFFCPDLALFLLGFSLVSLTHYTCLSPFHSVLTNATQNETLRMWWRPLTQATPDVREGNLCGSLGINSLTLPSRACRYAS